MKYEVYWTESVTYRTIVDAESIDEAKELVMSGEFSDTDIVDSEFVDIDSVGEW